MTIIRRASAFDNDVLETDYPGRPARALVAYHWNVKTGLGRFRYEGGGEPSVDARYQTKYLPLPHPSPGAIPGTPQG